MLTLSASAEKAIGRFIKGAESPVAGMRIPVTGGGCSGMQYALALEEAANADDTVIECKGVSIFVDPLSVPMLQGVTVDYLDCMEGSGFKFTNPNAAGSCGFGKSFSA
jgi:iron-sulfur cluster assembly protein